MAGCFKKRLRGECGGWKEGWGRGEGLILWQNDERPTIGGCASGGLFVLGVV